MESYKQHIVTSKEFYMFNFKLLSNSNKYCSNFLKGKVSNLVWKFLDQLKNKHSHLSKDSIHNMYRIFMQNIQNSLEIKIQIIMDNVSTGMLILSPCTYVT